VDGPVEIDTNRAVAIIHTLPRYLSNRNYICPIVPQRGSTTYIHGHYRILLDHDVDCFTKLH